MGGPHVAAQHVDAAVAAVSLDQVFRRSSTCRSRYEARAQAMGGEHPASVAEAAFQDMGDAGGIEAPRQQAPGLGYWAK